MTFEEFADALFKRHDIETYTSLSRRDAEMMMRAAWFQAREEYAREKLLGAKQPPSGSIAKGGWAPADLAHPYKSPEPKYNGARQPDFSLNEIGQQDLDTFL